MHRYFSSKRERRLWTWTLVIIIAIYATLGIAQTLTGIIRDRGLIDAGFWIGLLLVGASIAAFGWRRRLGRLEIGIGLGVAAVYLITFLRMAIPEERSHLIEYSIVALLIDEALRERAANGRAVPLPALLAIVITVAIGVLDESVQFILPNRVFDWRDILFNLMAAVMAVVGSGLLRWARHRFQDRSQRLPEMPSEW